MPPLTREQAVAALKEGRAAVDAHLAGLSDEQMAAPGPDGGWSPKDLLGHLAFWEELALRAVSEVREGRPLSIEPIFAGGDTTVDAANEKNHHESAAMSLADSRIRAETAHSRLIETIEAMPDAEWRRKFADADGHKRPLRDLLGSIVGAPKRPFGHAFAHLPDLRT